SNPLSESVRAIRVAPPHTCLHICEQLRGDVSGFRQEMAGALAAQLEVLDQLWIEEHDGLRAQSAILCRPEGQDVNARAPRDIGWMAIEEGHRVGEAGAIHVHLHSAGV